MKYIVVILLFLTHIGVFAQGKYLSAVTSIDGSALYFNRNIRKDPDLKNSYYVWVKREYPAGSEALDNEIKGFESRSDYANRIQEYVSFGYTTSLYLINITKQQYKMLSTTYYTVEGNPIYSYDYKEDQTDWIYAVPESVLEGLIAKIQEYLLKKNKKSRNPL